MDGDTTDGRWLTYPELADLRGIDRASAMKLAARHKWRRQRDNRHTVRVLVPIGHSAPRDMSPDMSRDMSHDMSGDMAALEATISGLRADLAALRQAREADLLRAEASETREAALRIDLTDVRQAAEADRAGAARDREAAAAERARLLALIETITGELGWLRVREAAPWWRRLLLGR